MPPNRETSACWRATIRRPRVEGRVEATDRLRGLVGEVAVFGGIHVADLPLAVHLVAEAPEAAVPRLLATVLCPEVGPVAVVGVVDVLDEVAGGVEAARAEVDGEHHLGAGLLGPVGELVDADLVGLGGVPREIQPLWPVGLRADAVLPVVG